MGRRSAENIWVGIDIGNTKSEYIACDASGTIVAYVVGPGANHQAIGLDEAQRRVRESYRELVGEVHSPAYVFVGAAGADTPADFTLLETQFSALFGPTGFSFDNDGLIALKNGVEDRRGLVVTCGTGNTNFAVDESGRIERIGGLIDHLGDKLGAYAIARAAMSAAARGEDRRDAPTALTGLLTSEFGVASMADLVNVPLDSVSVRRVIETLFVATAMGDGRSLAVAWEFVEEIVRIVDLFAASMFRDGRPFTVVLDGPVYRADYRDFLTMIRLAIESRYPAEIVIPETPPVVGALYMALERSGTRLERSHFQSAKESFRTQKVTV